MSNSETSSARLSKILSTHGIGSRRMIDKLIDEQRILVNGKYAVLGQLYVPGDRVVIDGKPIMMNLNHKPELEIIKFHKPIHTICSYFDEEGRPLIYEYLPPPAAGKWINVGRLDFKTTGLLLLTNDGDLANELMHPRKEVEREYHIKVQGQVTPKELERLVHGVMLSDGLAKAHSAEILSVDNNTWVKVVLKEGRNREVRRMIEALYKNVLKLSRVRYGNVNLTEGLGSGQYQYLTDEEIKSLKKVIGSKKGLATSRKEIQRNKGDDRKGGAKGGT